MYKNKYLEKISFTMLHGLAGVAGAAVGGTAGYLSADEDHKIRNSLVGAGIGAAVGVGGTHYLLGKHLAKPVNNKPLLLTTHPPKPPTIKVDNLVGIADFDLHPGGMVVPSAESKTIEGYLDLESRTRRKKTLRPKSFEDVPMASTGTYSNTGFEPQLSARNKVPLLTYKQVLHKDAPPSTGNAKASADLYGPGKTYRSDGRVHSTAFDELNPELHPVFSGHTQASRLRADFEHLPSGGVVRAAQTYSREEIQALDRETAKRAREIRNRRTQEALRNKFTKRLDAERASRKRRREWAALNT
jgi:hypothetical protein